MLLTELFKKENIKVNLEAEDKEEVFEELVNLLVEAENLACRDQILEAIIKREKKMSTGIQKGIAIPHGKLKDVKRLYGVIGVSSQGIDYDALDGEPVNLLFMVVACEDEPGEHIKALQKIAGLLENKEFQTRLIHADSSNEVFSVLSEYEELKHYENLQ